MTGKQRLALWICGALLLFALNLRRDLNRMARRYEWTAVEVKTLHQTISNTGVMEAVRVAEIKSEVDESIDRKMVQEGQPVKAGQPLLELSRAKTQLEFQQRNNMYLNAEGDYKKSVRELALQKKLLKNLAVSRSQVEDSARAKERAAATLDIARRELEISRKKLDGTLVRSPMDGVVLKDSAPLGTRVTAGKDLMIVGDISKFIVRTKVDELDFQHVHPGQPVKIIADAYPGKSMEGVVRSVATQAERETFAKIEVLIDITNAGGLALKHNLSVRVHIVTEDLPAAIGVPARSILRKDGDRGWVVVRNKFNLVNEREIALGKTAGEEVQALSGLKAGELVGTEKSEPAP